MSSKFTGPSFLFLSTSYIVISKEIALIQEVLGTHFSPWENTEYILFFLQCAWCILSCFSPVWFFATPWTIASQVPLSTEFSRQVYRSGLSFPPPGEEIFMTQELNRVSCIASRFFTAWAMTAYKIIKAKDIILLQLWGLKQWALLGSLYPFYCRRFNPVIESVLSMHMDMCMHARSLELYLTLCNPMDHSQARLLCTQDSPGKTTGVACHVLLQGIFPDPGIEPMSHVSCIQKDSLQQPPPGKPCSVH